MQTFPHSQHFAISAYAGPVPLANKRCLVKKSDEKGDAEDSHMEDDAPGPLDNATTTPLTLSVGQWVLVRYNGLEFSGEVTYCGKTDAETSTYYAQNW